MYSTGTCARVLRGTVSAAHHQFSTASQSSRCPQLSLCLQQGISATRPQNGSEGFLSRVESFRHLFQSWKRCERVLLLRYFPRYPSFSMDYFILFLLLYAWYAWLQNGCCERSGVRRTAPFSHSHSLSLSLSPSVTRAITLPSPSFSQHLPTLSFSISSSPSLSFSQTHWDMHYSGFSQLLLCHCQPCQLGRFASPNPEGNKWKVKWIWKVKQIFLVAVLISVNCPVWLQRQQQNCRTVLKNDHNQRWLAILQYIISHLNILPEFCYKCTYGVIMIPEGR